MTTPWQYTAPPNETLVEIELDGQIIQAKAFYGRDGYRPHWRSADGNTCWDVSTFTRGRPITPSP